MRSPGPLFIVSSRGPRSNTFTASPSPVRATTSTAAFDLPHFHNYCYAERNRNTFEQATGKRPANARDLAREADLRRSAQSDGVGQIRITVDREVFLATETIPKGAVIRADQVATPTSGNFRRLIDRQNCACRSPEKSRAARLPAGQPILAGELDILKDVFRGESVHVQAIDGGASIRFDAIAQHPGKRRGHYGSQPFERKKLSRADRRPRTSASPGIAVRQGVFAEITFVVMGMALLSTPLAAAKKAAATQHRPWINTFKR